MDATTRADTGARTRGSRPGRNRDGLQPRGGANQGGRARRLVGGDVARPLRFVLTGGVAGVTQLALLALLTRHGWPELAANGVAFLLAAQVNFALSVTFTWRGRCDGRSLGRRWLAFHGAIAGMAVVNMLIFAASRTIAPTLVASLLGIGVAAVGNFVIGDRLVFRTHAQAPARRAAPRPEGRADATVKAKVVA